MIGESRPISLEVLVNGGTAKSAKAVSLGLIVTELVINALKHAFPKDRPDGRIIVSYEIDGSDWKLAVSDNGIGKPDVISHPAKGGLGTTLVKALAQDLDAKGRNRQQSGRRERVAHAHGQLLAAIPNGLIAPAS
jgi:chemotaxis protein methyltransferase CheR